MTWLFVFAVACRLPDSMFALILRERRRPIPLSLLSFAGRI